MTISYIVQPEEFDALVTHGQSAPNARFGKALLLFIFVGFMGSLLFSHYFPAPQNHVARFAFHRRDPTSGILGMLLPMILLVCFWGFFIWSRKMRYAKIFATDPEYSQPCVTEITPEYLRHQTASGEVKTRWNGVHKVVETATHIFLWNSPNEAHIVPKRAFANEEDALRFARMATDYWQQAQP